MHKTNHKISFFNGSEVWLIFAILIFSQVAHGQSSIDKNSLDSVVTSDIEVPNDLVKGGLKVPEGLNRDSIVQLGDSAFEWNAIKQKAKAKIDSTNFLNFDSYKGSKSKLNGLDSPKDNGLVGQSSRFIKSHSKFSGVITSESFTTNYQDPFTLSEKSYSRLYGNPTLQLAGLPFICDFYLTTEPNNAYNSNSFSLSFDVEQYKNNLLAKSKEKVSGLENEKKRLNNLKLIQKKQLMDLKNLSIKNKQEIDLLKNSPKLNIDLPSDTLGDVSHQLRQKFDQKIPDRNLIDTTGLKDSLINDKGLVSDGQELYEKYQALHEKQHMLEIKISQADSMIEFLNKSDSIVDSQLNTAKELLGNRKNTVVKKTEGKLKGNRLLNVLNNLDYFEVGINYPYFSDFALSGIPVKGINTSLSTKTHNFKMVAGKTFDTRFNTFGLNQPRPAFIRNVHGIHFSRIWDKAEFGISNTSLWDNDSVKEPKRNLIQSITYTRDIGNKLRIEINSAHSVYSSTPTNSALNEGIEKSSFGIQRLNQSAGKVKVKYNLDSKSKIKLEAKRIYPGFINLGNPYMSNGYDEFRGDLDRKLFNRKIHASIFYKHFSDNITNIQQATNKMQGYGIMIKSNFRQVPNFYFQHAPYEQGNNHPDSIFRTNNQLSVTSAGISHRVEKEKLKLFFLSNVTRSQIEFNYNSAPIENLFYNIMIQVQNSSLKMSLNGYRNQSKPVVDSLNYMGIRITLDKNLTKKLIYNTSFFWDKYDSDDYRYNWINSISTTVLKSMMIKSSFGLGRIEGLYGIEQKSIFSGSLIVSYKF